MSAPSNYIQLIAGCVAISFSAIFVKLAPVAPTFSAFYRCFYSMLILLGISFLYRRTEFAPNTGGWFWPSLFAGLFLAVDLIIWHKTIFYIGAGPATVLGNSQIVFVSLFGYFFWKEKISRWFLLLMPAIFTGLYLAVPKTLAMVSPEVGFGLGIMVGITYAGFLLCLHFAKQRTPENYPEIFSLALIMLVTAAVIGCYGLAVENIHFLVWDGKTHFILILMALIPQSLGWIWIKRSITRIPPHQGSLWLLVQPILTTLWGGWFFREPLQALQILGMILALGSIAWYQFRLAPRREIEILEE